MNSLLSTFFVLSFAQDKEYIVCHISFSIFSAVLSPFICVKPVGSPWRIYLGINILILYQGIVILPEISLKNIYQKI